MRNQINKSKHTRLSLARLQRYRRDRSSPPGRNRPKTDPDREERITMEVVVDAYDASERATGWFGYLENALEFPFTARCMERRGAFPPLRGGGVGAGSVGAPGRGAPRKFVLSLPGEGGPGGGPFSLRPAGG